MSRVACSLVLLAVISGSARGADLPPGALVRLGDDRFRAGGEIEHLALSPDGKQVATLQNSSRGTLILKMWDADTGRLVREQEVNADLFKGFVWGPSGGFAIVVRAEPGTKGKLGKLVPDDFRVWQFADPKAVSPPLLPAVQVGLSGYWNQVQAERPQGGSLYRGFFLSADGKRVAARLKTEDEKYTVHVFDLKPTNTATKLVRAGTIELGAEGADAVHLSTDGKALVVFRKFANDESECTATTWDVASGKPTKPVRVPFAHRLMVAPDARSLVTCAVESEEWGFDQYDLTTGKQRKLTRWPRNYPDGGRPDEQGGFAFSSSGRDLAVVCDRKVYVIDLVAGKERGRLEGHTVLMFDANPIVTAMSADGTRIATADSSGVIRLWDAKTLRPLDDAPGHRAPVDYAQLSPDGKRLLTWAPDRTVRLWDVATGKELRVRGHGSRNFSTAPAARRPPDVHARRHNRPVHHGETPHRPRPPNRSGSSAPCRPEGTRAARAVFAPDGKSVLTWAAPEEEWKTCEVWSWPKGQKLASWTSNADDFYFCPGFSSDGSVIFTYSTSPERRDAKTGKELAPAWKGDHSVERLNSLCPYPQWAISVAEDTAGVIEAGTGKAVPGFQLAHLTGFARAFALDWALSPTRGQFATPFFGPSSGAIVGEVATGDQRRRLLGHRGESRVLGFTPDGTKLLTAGGDHTVLVWDMRLQSVPLPDAIKKETSAAKLWDTLATGKAEAAYLAMARLSREPDAAFKLLKMKLKPAAKGDAENDKTNLTDCRAIELLEALGTDESRALLKELAGGDAKAFRTQEAKRALERHK